MSTYAAYVTTTVDHISDDALDDLVDELAPVAGVPSMLGGRLSVQLTVEAHSIRAAHDVAVEAVQSARAASGAAIVVVEVMTQAEFDRRLDGDPPPDPDLVPTTEAAEILGVKRQRIAQLAKAFENFPRPVRRKVAGREVLLWSKPDLRRFLAEWEPHRKSGPKPKPKPTATSADGKTGERLTV